VMNGWGSDAAHRHPWSDGPDASASAENVLRSLKA
jgi:hypothetical protein